MNTGNLMVLLYDNYFNTTALPCAVSLYHRFVTEPQCCYMYDLLFPGFAINSSH